MAIRIIFDGNNIDLNIGSMALQPSHFQQYSQNRSGSGKIEQINEYGIEIMSFDALFQIAVERQLQAWWAWARQGKTWSFNMDSDNVGNTTLDGAAAAGQKNVPLTATAAFAGSDECLLRAEDNDDEFEIVIIDSVDAGVKVVATDNLIYSYTSGDTFRHREYWPAVKTLDKDFKPPKDGSWYSWTFNFAEAL